MSDIESTSEAQDQPEREIYWPAVAKELGVDLQRVEKHVDGDIVTEAHWRAAIQMRNGRTYCAVSETQEGLVSVERIRNGETMRSWDALLHSDGRRIISLSTSPAAAIRCLVHLEGCRVE